MTLVIGTDEAGYGPNLGPLVVAATAWRLAAAPPDAAESLARALADVDTLLAAAGTRPPLWGDSKQVYRGGKGFDALERGVCVGLLLTDAGDTSMWHGLERAVGPISAGGDEWRDLATRALPRVAAIDACRPLAATVRERLAAHGVALERIACRGIYPAEFNGLLDTGSNKSDILSAATLDLASRLREQAAAVPTLVWCDRHGGRKAYGGLVSRHFDAALVQAVEETPTRSVYLVPGADDNGPAACRVEFCVGGESRGPVALASMTAKYVRELAMEAFNAFWSARVPGLRATAGYPLDAARWRRDAAAALAAAGIADDRFWRRA
jgi:ribonuclease HII